MSLDPHLSQQSQLILEKLREEVMANQLTEKELDSIREWCRVYESVGVLGKALTRIAAFVLVIVTIVSYAQGWWKK